MSQKAYLGTTIVDGKHLFQFTNPPPNQEKQGSAPYSENTYYTNDTAHIERMKSMLNDIWKNASAPSTITLESILRPTALRVILQI